MKCLILGGGGFIGLHLCEALVNQGIKVRIFERPKLKFQEPTRFRNHVEWFEGDFSNSSDVLGALKDCEVVFHLISTVLPKNSNADPIYDLESNVIATVKMLDLARECKIRKIIFVSSGGTIYGNPKIIPVPETHPTDPLCSYGVGKLAIEKYLQLYNHLYGLDYCILRLSNPYGERQPTNTSQGAVAVFLQKALRGELIEIWGDGNVVRDYIYIKDVIDAMLNALNYQGVNRIFNIGCGHGYSINEVISTIESVIGHQIKKKYKSSRSFDVSVNILDISLAREFLHWEPKTSFYEGLTIMREWIINNKSFL